MVWLDFEVSVQMNYIHLTLTSSTLDLDVLYCLGLGILDHFDREALYHLDLAILDHFDLGILYHLDLGVLYHLLNVG